MQLDEEICYRLRKINWFGNCGNPIKDFDYIYICSWNEATKYFTESNWEETTLYVHNELTQFLHDKYQREYSYWNKLVKEAKMFLETSIFPNIYDYKETHSINNLFIECVKWDLLSIVMESSYQKKVPKGIRGFYSKDLLNIYTSGNFPCGYQGKWPTGGLIVY